MVHRICSFNSSAPKTVTCGRCTVFKVCQSARLSSWRSSSRLINAYIVTPKARTPMKQALVILIGVTFIMNIANAIGEVSYRTIRVDDLDIFYREAGPKDGPTILLLHGLPSSSRMFEPLFNRLADRYHLVAPDYPGFGHSDWPNPKGFAYTFDHYAEIITRFTEALGILRYTMYMQDYGGPVGFRMVL